MRIRQVVAGSATGLLVSAAAVLLAGAAAAAPAPSLPAATYPPVSSTVGLSSTDVHVGETITVTADGFKPLSAATVTTSVGGVLGTGKAPGSVSAAGSPFQVYPATADSFGVVTATVTFDEPGEHTVTISGITPAGVPRSVTTSLSVQPAAAAAGGVTGPRTVQGADDEQSSNLLEYGALGAGVLVLVGLGVVSLRVRSARASARPAKRSGPFPPTGPAVAAATAMAPATVYPSGHPSAGPGAAVQPPQAAQPQQPVQPAQVPVAAVMSAPAAFGPTQQG